MNAIETRSGLHENANDKGISLTLLYIGKSASVKHYLGLALHATEVHRESYFSAINYLVSGGRPNVIFCDARLTGGTAIEMHRYIREQAELSRTAFIIVSDQFSEEDFKTALTNRVDDYFVLPLPAPQALRDRVRFLVSYRLGLLQSNRQEEPGPRPRIPLSKRIFDLIVALSALVLLTPFLVLVMAAIRLESPGKVWYTSRRVGQRPFNFYKFRSMRTGAEAELGKLAKEKNKYAGTSSKDAVDYSLPCTLCHESKRSGPCSHVLHRGPGEICEPWYHYQKAEIARSKASFIKIKDDPRITRVGKIIRDLSIDELPQLINVIKGDMSLVGNRPLPVYEAEKLTDDRMALRFLSPAGLTGLWQVELRGRAGAMSEAERKRLDNKYATLFIRNKYSIWYDLRLILRTIPALFQKETV